jgi:hypothetical protein
VRFAYRFAIDQITDSDEDGVVESLWAEVVVFGAIVRVGARMRSAAQHEKWGD